MSVPRAPQPLRGAPTALGKSLPAADSADPRDVLVRGALEQLSALEPEEAEGLVALLLEAVRAGQIPFSTLLGYSDDDLYDIYRKAHMLQKSGRPKNAIVLCEGLLSLSPGHGAVTHLMASCLLDLGEHAKALELIDKLLAEGDTDPELLLKKGFILYRMKRVVAAGLTFQKLVDADPGLESDEAQQAQRILEHLHAEFGG